MEQPYNDRADVYALAMCVWEILTSEVPFSEFDARRAAKAKRKRQEEVADELQRKLNRAATLEEEKQGEAFASRSPRHRTLSDAQRSEDGAMSPRSFRSAMTQPTKHSNANSRRASLDVKAFSQRQVQVRAWLQDRKKVAERPVRPATILGGSSAQARGFLSIADKERALRRAICEDFYRPPLPHGVPVMMQGLLEMGWHPDTKKRLSARQFRDALRVIKPPRDEDDSEQDEEKPNWKRPRD